jgi:RND family efflux transporter MFP subunit
MAMHTRIVFASLAAAAALAACGSQEPPPPPPRPVVTVTAAPVAGTEIAVYSGEVRARREADLGFRIPGKIVARYVDVGTPVRKGAALAKLDPADAQLNVAASQSALAAAETEYQFAKAELDRYGSLLQKQFISQAVFDQKQNAFNAAKARYEQAQSQLAVVRNQSAYTTLVADQDGVVTAVNAEAGQVVSAGQAVVRIARPEEREVLINVPETRLEDLKAGTREILVRTLAEPDKTYRGTVREIAPNADAATRTFATRIAIAEPGPGVALGMTANVMLMGKDGRGIVLPLTSIYRKGNEPAVWVVDPKAGTVRLQPVTVAQYREDGAVIASGLAGGEQIVAAGVNKLVEGQVVAPAAATAEGKRS